jgi:hypothetical protein
MSEKLNGVIANHVANGWRVELEQESQVILAKSKPVNHLLHLILSFLTFWCFGGWIWVWGFVVLRRKELRMRVTEENGKIKEHLNLNKNTA